MMRRPILTLLLLVLCLGCVAQDFPKRIFSGYQGDFHVQGAAYDRQRQCVYMSFTTKLMKYDLQGRLIASVNGLTGHLGCIGINPDDGRLYGSLEYKHDVIGTGITGNLGVKNDARTGFYVAIFDLDKIDRIDMSPDEVMTTVYIPEVVADCEATVINNGRQVAHRYGASGIDGLTFAPQWGKRSGRNYLYLGYGVYGDTTRTDNDYQVLLCYDVRQWSRYARKIDPTHIHESGPTKPRAKYFVYTGNSDYGIQNLEYDASTGYMFAAVYHGYKSQWPRYEMYAIDTRVKPHKGWLRGVEPREKAPLLTLVRSGKPSAGGEVWGWERTRGATGMIALGNGLFYFSENGLMKTKGKGNYTNLRLYRWSDDKGFVRQ